MNMYVHFFEQRRARLLCVRISSHLHEYSAFNSISLYSVIVSLTWWLLPKEYKMERGDRRWLYSVELNKSYLRWVTMVYVSHVTCVDSMYSWYEMMTMAYYLCSLTSIKPWCQWEPTDRPYQMASDQWFFRYVQPAVHGLQVDQNSYEYSPT